MWIFCCEHFFRILLFLLFPLIFCNDVRAAAAVGDEVETVEATEGETVTLKTNWTEIKRDDMIQWTFGTEGYRIARLLNNEIFTDYDEKFKDRLQLNSLTGSLTISNIRTTDTGLYKVQFISEYTSIKHFRVTVYATLPVPNITLLSSPGCSVVCSVKNGFRVTLSWYNMSHRLSSISDPDNSTLSLPLNIEHCDESIYSCVAANPIINQTIQLNQATHCSCPFKIDSRHLIILLIPVLLIVVVMGVAIYLLHLKSSTGSDQQINRSTGSRSTGFGDFFYFFRNQEGQSVFINNESCEENVTLSDREASLLFCCSGTRAYELGDNKLSEWSAGNLSSDSSACLFYTA